MYLACGTQLDISYIIKMLSWYNSHPRIRHLFIIKQILYYLKTTINVGIIWRADFVEHQERYGPIKIVGYTDSSYIGDSKDKKSITRYCFFLGGGIVT